MTNVSEAYDALALTYAAAGQMLKTGQLIRVRSAIAADDVPHRRQEF
jgi:hypothetical protein